MMESTMRSPRMSENKLPMMSENRSPLVIQNRSPLRPSVSTEMNKADLSNADYSPITSKYISRFMSPEKSHTDQTDHAKIPD